MSIASLCVFRDNGESWRQQPATSSGHGFSVLEAVCRLRGQNRRPLPPLHHGQLLAQPMPQVLLLPGPAGRNRHVVLHKKRDDPLQKRLHQVRRERFCNECNLDRLKFLIPDYIISVIGTGWIIYVISYMIKKIREMILRHLSKKSKSLFRKDIKSVWKTDL